MLFHDQVFIVVFFPIVLGAFYLLHRFPVARTLALIVGSIVFYSWWDVRFTPLILSQILISWLLMEAFFRFRHKALIWLVIVANLSVLFLFKYVNFLVETVEGLLGLSLPTNDWILPIGISFYTFQIIAYVVDVLRDQNAARYSIRQFALFILFFPQLIAGPIVRHYEIVSQFDLPVFRQGWAERLGKGMLLFIAAIAIKIFLADQIAGYVDKVFALAQFSTPTLSDSLLGALGFSLQIFFDFASYTDMAIALALCFGMQLPLNFNQPFRALNIQDFWRRWHMTLSHFFRDYLYIPLGGSRHGFFWYVVASLSTMGLCGLWHGAGWSFIVWGLGHGLALIACRYWPRLGISLPWGVSWLLTFSFVIALFVIFRAPSLEASWHILEGLWTTTSGQKALWDDEVLLLMGVALVLSLLPHSIHKMIDLYARPHPALAVVASFIFVAIIVESAKNVAQTFIYFQF